MTRASPPSSSASITTCVHRGHLSTCLYKCNHGRHRLQQASSPLDLVLRPHLASRTGSDSACLGLQRKLEAYLDMVRYGLVGCGALVLLGIVTAKLAIDLNQVGGPAMAPTIRRVVLQG